MATVQLKKSVQLTPGGIVHAAGEVIDIDDHTRDQLLDWDAITISTPEPESEPVEVETHIEESEPSQPELPRPAKTAPLATWQKYATALGIDPKGLTKQEIIAATS